MIIVSQDKKYIVNFDNVETIGVDKSNYRQYNTDNNKAVTILPKVYEMPKE